MDLNKEIQLATDRVIIEQLPKMVETKVSKMVNDVLDDVFRSYSDTAKEIKAKIEEALDVSLVEFSLTDYNSMVAKAIVGELGKEIDLKPISELVRGIVGKSELKQITISELCDKVKDLAMDKDKNESYEGEVTFIVKETDSKRHIEISADLEADKNKENCAVTICVSNSSGRIFMMNTYNYFHQNKPISPSTLVNMEEVEKLFFSLYNNQVHIINDYEDCYTSWSRD